MIKNLSIIFLGILFLPNGALYASETPFGSSFQKSVSLPIETSMQIQIELDKKNIQDESFQLLVHCTKAKKEPRPHCSVLAEMPDPK